MDTRDLLQQYEMLPIYNEAMELHQTVCKEYNIEMSDPMFSSRKKTKKGTNKAIERGQATRIVKQAQTLGKRTGFRSLRKQWGNC